MRPAGSQLRSGGGAILVKSGNPIRGGIHKCWVSTEPRGRKLPHRNARTGKTVVSASARDHLSRDPGIGPAGHFRRRAVVLHQRGSVSGAIFVWML